MPKRLKAAKRKVERRTSDIQAYCNSVLPASSSSIKYLIDRLTPSAKEVFPFEHALSLHLLFIAALWPNDRQRLLTAARIFAGSTNFHIATVGPKAVFTCKNEHLHFHNEFSKSRLALFNEGFFKILGGLNSLFFTDSVTAFYRDVHQRVTDLQMMHDVISFLIKASVVSPQLSSSRLAFEAVARNIFDRPNGYGVHLGAKRMRSHGKVTTVNSVREKWKRSPETILLSFVMTEMFGPQNFSPSEPQFLAYTHIVARRTPGKFITILLKISQAYLARNRRTQNKSIEKWTQLLPARPFKGGIGGPLRFSDIQLDRVFTIVDSVFKKPLLKEQKAEFRRNNMNLSFGAFSPAD